jgi:glyoxylase I family protein
MSIEVTAVDHVYVTVRSIERSEAFYDGVMRLLGFKKGTKPIAGDRHLHYFNPVTQYTIRPAKTDVAHDPYAPGLHHLCFRVATREDVNAAADGLRALGIAATEPRLYPEYADDYWATFFVDPDGLRLEIVAHRRMRSILRDRWAELTEFEDPLTKAGIV